jgi:sugar/nucleoside kinase (ribokinase family)
MSFLGVFGHVNIDYLMKVEKLPAPNTCIQVSDVKRLFGGTGANIAILASKMGVKTSLASFVGKDFPEDFRSLFKNAGVDITDLKEIKGEPTPTCRLLTDPEGSQIGIMDQGPMGHMQDFGLARHTVKNSQVIHVGTGRPEYYKGIMQLASDLNKKIHFDPAQEIHYVYNAASFRELLKFADALFVNKSELATALRYLKKKDKKALLEHVDTLVLTLGKEGSQIFRSREKIDIPAIKPKKIKDPTGAGDAYRAGFYAGMSRKMDMEMCGLLGASAASFILEVEGPLGKLPTFKEVLARASMAKN